MDKIIKVAFALAALVVAGSIYFYYVIFLPKIENEKQTKLEAEQLAESRRIAGEKILAEEKAAAKELMRKSAYESCLLLAEKSYDVTWKNECKAGFVARCSTTVKSMEKDLKLYARLTNQPYNNDAMKMCETENINWSNCKLSTERADIVNEQYRHDKEMCLGQARADL
jgi:hypothetical protein